MIGVPIFTILAAICGFGWNYYSLKIKEVEKKERSNEPSKSIENIYNVSGDVIQGTKNNIIDNNEVFVLEIGNTNVGPNPYFTYSKNEMDFIVTAIAVGKTVAHIKSKTLTLVMLNENQKPIDKKAFFATDLNDKDIIFKERPFTFSQKMGNLPKELFKNLYVVIDIEYSNETNTKHKLLRKIYKVETNLAEKKLPQIDGEKYDIISDFIDK
ncbi:hypothetical protein GCM10011364_23620 [Mangrovimonas yunxiaonensis]|nr:hypothetical protein GCM10011364_23620 [Mangrovimonas yunxiaonensis]